MCGVDEVPFGDTFKAQKKSGMLPEEFRNKLELDGKKGQPVYWLPQSGQLEQPELVPEASHFLAFFYRLGGYLFRSECP